MSSAKTKPLLATLTRDTQCRAPACNDPSDQSSNCTKEQRVGRSNSGRNRGVIEQRERGTKIRAGKTTKGNREREKPRAEGDQEWEEQSAGAIKSSWNR